VLLPRLRVPVQQVALLRRLHSGSRRHPLELWALRLEQQRSQPLLFLSFQPLRIRELYRWQEPFARVFLQPEKGSRREVEATVHQPEEEAESLRLAVPEAPRDRESAGDLPLWYKGDVSDLLRRQRHQISSSTM